MLALRFGIRAARISGMGFEGATDPMMLGFVWESPLGTAAMASAPYWLILLLAVILLTLMPQIALYLPGSLM